MPFVLCVLFPPSLLVSDNILTACALFSWLIFTRVLFPHLPSVVTDVGILRMSQIANLVVSSFVFQDVIRAMNVNPKISFPPEVDFCLLSNFIREICCIAFAMQSLDPPLDIAFGADGEVFNDFK
jgi:hypothetical protein